MDYYSHGLCARCHPTGPRPVDSCRACHAWGATRYHTWVCWPCRGWNIKYPLGVCASCHAVVAIDPHGVCRLCLRNAKGSRGPKNTFDPIGANRNGQQLFLADMHKALARKGPKPRPTSSATPVPRPVSHRQLLLFEMDHDLSRGYGVVREPPIPALAAGLEALSRVHARRHGWHYNYAYKVRAGIRVLLGLQVTSGAPLTRSETAVLNRCNLPERPVCLILEEAGLLVDDRAPTIERWFDRTVADVPDQMIAELRVWLTVMADGSATPPRRRPRSETTIRIYLGSALPVLQRMGKRWPQLPARDLPRRRYCCPVSLRRRPWAHPQKSQIDLQGTQGTQARLCQPSSQAEFGDLHRAIPLPVDPAVISDALHSPDPARAAVTALVAFHGLRSNQLRALQLTDFRDRRLYLPGRVVLLAGPVIERLGAYLDYRRARWPTTTNPHLFLNHRNAIRTQPVGNRWVWLTLDIPGGSQALREDRILNEAQATGGDVRRLCDLFGLSVAAATRYTNTVDPPDLVADLLRPRVQGLLAKSNAKPGPIDLHTV